jgi:hypothetical protein
MRSLCVLLKLIRAIASAVWLSGCSVLIPGPLETAVGQDQVDLATRAFIDSSSALAYAFYYETEVDVAPVLATANKITGIGNKRTVRLEVKGCPPGARCSLPNPAELGINYSPGINVVTNYVRNGWHLSQLLCRNYLAGLSEKNSAFSAIKKELNIAGGLAQLTMAAAKASARSIAYFGAVEAFVNASLENFGEFEYLTPDQSALQDMVFKAQNALGEYYSGVKVPVTIVEAINAVHRIESQCTRAGLRHLINQALTKSDVQADPVTGALLITGDVTRFNPTVSFADQQNRLLALNAIDRNIKYTQDQLAYWDIRRANGDPDAPATIANLRKQLNQLLQDRARVAF